MEVTGGKYAVFWDDYDAGTLWDWWLIKVGPIDENIDRTDLKARIWTDDDESEERQNVD